MHKKIIGIYDFTYFNVLFKEINSNYKANKLIGHNLKSLLQNMNKFTEIMNQFTSFHYSIKHIKIEENKEANTVIKKRIQNKENGMSFIIRHLSAALLL
jgi:hypothetical protein